MAILTKNLSIPKLEPQNIFDVVKDVNDALDTIDKNALATSHQKSKAHFDMWQPNHFYKAGDIVRTDSIPSWGVLKAGQTGESSTEMPVLNNPGDTFIDGHISWTLEQIGNNDTRTIVFMGTLWQIPYPWNGTLEKITILCPTVLPVDTDFSVKKISNIDYVAGNDNWQELGTGVYTIPANQNYLDLAISVNNIISNGDIIKLSTDAKNLDMTVFNLYVINY